MKHNPIVLLLLLMVGALLVVGQLYVTLPLAGHAGTSLCGAPDCARLGAAWLVGLVACS